MVRNTGDAVLIPGHGIKIPQATWYGQKKKVNYKNYESLYVHLKL